MPSSWTADTVTYWLLAYFAQRAADLAPAVPGHGMSCLAALIPPPGQYRRPAICLVLAFQLLGLPGVTGFSLATLAQGCCIAGSTLVGGGLYLLAALGNARTRPKLAGPPVP